MQNHSVSTPSHVPSFDDLLVKMMPHFRYFASKMKRRYKRFDFDDGAIQELVGFALENYRSLVCRGKEVSFTASLHKFKDAPIPTPAPSPS